MMIEYLALLTRNRNTDQHEDLGKAATGRWRSEFSDRFTTARTYSAPSLTPVCSGRVANVADGGENKGQLS